MVLRISIFPVYSAFALYFNMIITVKTSMELERNVTLWGEIKASLHLHWSFSFLDLMQLKCLINSVAWLCTGTEEIQVCGRSKQNLAVTTSVYCYWTVGQASTAMKKKKKKRESSLFNLGLPTLVYYTAMQMFILFRNENHTFQCLNACRITLLELSFVTDFKWIKTSVLLRGTLPPT